MSGPTHSANPGEPGPAVHLPGHFVSDEHRTDCARFLAEVKTMVARRRDAGRDPRRRAADGA
jgi:hypothetical protein